MQQGGFLDERKLSPSGMALIIAMHGAVLAALILAPPEQIERIKDFTMISIPEKKDPPPLPEPLPLAKPVTATEKIAPAAVLVPSTTPTSNDIVVPSADPLPQLTAMIDPMPMKEPVLVEARPDPRFADRFQPDYPPAMARAEINGVVVVRVLIGAEGRVLKVEQVSATDPAFFAATERQALRHWRFKPATRGGVAVEAWRTMSVRFNMLG